MVRRYTGLPLIAVCAFACTAPEVNKTNPEPERALANATDSATWLTSYKDAVGHAKKNGKPILADFTGSDWCGWCIKLKEEVFSTDAFKQWASQNVVLLEVDFPAYRPQPDELKQQNEELARKYEVRGYPTILFLNEQGEILGRSGYRQGGPESWIINANGILSSR